MIDAETIACWKRNYGLDKRCPWDAMRWWNEMNNGNAPAGAVAALGLCLEEIKNHAAFVERVREMAEAMECVMGCPAVKCEHCGYHPKNGIHDPWAHGEKCAQGFTPEGKCTCPRGQLLEVLNG